MYGPSPELLAATARFPEQLLSERIKLWELEPRAAAEEVLQASSNSSAMESARLAVYGMYGSATSPSQLQATRNSTEQPEREGVRDAGKNAGQTFHQTQHSQMGVGASNQKTDL